MLEQSFVNIEWAQGMYLSGKKKFEKIKQILWEWQRKVRAILAKSEK